MFAIELLFADRACDAVVHSFGPLCNIRPRVHHLNLVMKSFCFDLSGAQRSNSFARRQYQIVFLRFCEGCHMRWKDFRYTAHSGTNDVQATTSSLHDDSAESLGQAWMQVDMSSDHHIADFLVSDWAKQLHPVLKYQPFEHLLQVNSFGSGPSDDEANIGMRSEDAWYCRYQQVRSLVVKKPGYDHDHNRITRAHALRKWSWPQIVHLVSGFWNVRFRLEILGDHGVGDDRDHNRVKRGSKHSILLTCVTHTDDMVDIAKGEFEEFVRQDGTGVCESKERMIGEDCT